MIKVIKSTQPGRDRDKKRHRVILIIGDKMFNLTQQEARDVGQKLLRVFPTRTKSKRWVVLKDWSSSHGAESVRSYAETQYRQTCKRNPESNVVLAEVLKVRPVRF